MTLEDFCAKIDSGTYSLTLVSPQNPNQTPKGSRWAKFAEFGDNTSFLTMRERREYETWREQYTQAMTRYYAEREAFLRERGDKIRNFYSDAAAAFGLADHVMRDVVADTAQDFVEMWPEDEKTVTRMFFFYYRLAKLLVKCDVVRFDMEDLR